MNTLEKLENIKQYRKWTKIIAIEKGWSSDKKFFVQDREGCKYLLRVSDISELERKRFEYEIISKIVSVEINMSMPVAFGICEENELIYQLFTWVEGEQAELILPAFSKKQQYSLGIESGRILKKIHRTFEDIINDNWEERYNKKVSIYMQKYEECGIRVPKDGKLKQYIYDNKHLLGSRNQTLQHGDYHVGNLIVDKNQKIGVIDFNRCDYGDSWEEFNRIIFSVSVSVPFAVGQINGYFSNDVPHDFFRLLAFYRAANICSAIPWSISFGQKEIEVALKNAVFDMEAYDDFSRDIPRWYEEFRL